MSKNRENVVWQSKNGSWNIGFYEVIENASSWNDEDHDDEWDVEYNENSFALLLQNHSTAESVVEAADSRWGNPGSHTIYAYTTHLQKDIADFETLAAYHLNPALRHEDEMKAQKKANLAHFKKLRAQFTENNNFAGLIVSVTIKMDDAAYTALGASRSYTNKLRLINDWLTVDGEKIYNPTTHRFNKRLHSVTFTRR